MRTTLSPEMGWSSGYEGSEGEDEELHVEDLVWFGDLLVEIGGNVVE